MAWHYPALTNPSRFKLVIRFPVARHLFRGKVRISVRDRSFFMRKGGLVEFEGGACEKIWLQRGGQAKKYGQ